MSEEEKLNNYLEDLYQAMQIGDIVFEAKDSFELYNLINEMLEENKKYKEVINKAIEYINLIVLGETFNGEPVLFKEEAEGQYLLDVLKEVE